MATWLVTGTSRGLGLEWVRQLRERGETVIATVRRDSDAAGPKALGAEVLELDAGSDADAAALARALEGRPIDVLVNNAGAGGSGPPFTKLQWPDVLHVVDVDAIGPLRVTQALWPNLLAGRRKLVANISSRMGSIADNGSGGSYGYRAAKAALNMLTKTLALDARRSGVTCVLLHPGWVRTAMGGSQAPLSPEESVKGMLAVLSSAGPAESGRFFDWSGAELPW